MYPPIPRPTPSYSVYFSSPSLLSPSHRLCSPQRPPHADVYCRAHPLDTAVPRQPRLRKSISNFFVLYAISNRHLRGQPRTADVITKRGRRRRRSARSACATATSTAPSAFARSLAPRSTFSACRCKPRGTLDTRTPHELFGTITLRATLTSPQSSYVISKT
eukprot:5072010-Pleurochrysis_carterae.AAC.1